MMLRSCCSSLPALPAAARAGHDGGQEHGGNDEAGAVPVIRLPRSTQTASKAAGGCATARPIRPESWRRPPRGPGGRPGSRSRSGQAPAPAADRDWGSPTEIP